ncbi:unnamed protein product [Pedinophyceae sp. YPF-701]|nr:unnamed protein product [Pedinophyceae sp. YPF-701]
MTMFDSEVAAVAERLAGREGRGILAADESTGTIGKRFVAVGVENTEDNRRKYRELFCTADVGDFFSGVILFKETLYQSASDGVPLVQHLARRGIAAGIKVDEGLEPVEGGREGETHTKGLAGLYERCVEYKKAGASFAKWRAALKVSPTDLPSEVAVETNAAELAEYAAICQRAGLCPIVEPEILLDGDHSIDRFEEVTTRVVQAVTRALWRHNVALEGSLLKPQMVTPGADWPGAKPAPEEVAERTLRALRRSLPAAVPGVMFLSGGQTEEEATANLNAINVARRAEGSRAPWGCSFSFGRALQASVLKIWSADMAATDEAQRMAAALARANAAAVRGEWDGTHPSLLGGKALTETFRGHTSHKP